MTSAAERDSGTVAQAGTASGSPSAVTCEGPTFTFGAQDRLVWATSGILRKTNGAYFVDVGMDLIFSTANYGKVKTSRVSLVCADCSREEWDSFDAGLGQLVGKHVRAKGIVRPAWSIVGDAEVPKDTPAVQLSTHVSGVTVLSNTEVAAANACISNASP